MKTLLLFGAIIFGLNSFGQQIIDSCLLSASPGGDFVSSQTLVNCAGQSDLLEWTGTDWTGAWPAALVTIAPPGNITDSRAFFIGDGTDWTTDGEGFCLQLDGPLVNGQTYSYDFTTVSHGFGENGNFAPYFYTNNQATESGGVEVGTLTPSGATWATSTFTFTATAAQDGHTWIIIHSGLTAGSGLVYQFCAEPSSSIGIPELTTGKKELLMIYDLLGREAEFKPNTPFIFIYTDGTRERVMEIKN